MEDKELVKIKCEDCGREEEVEIEGRQTVEEIEIETGYLVIWDRGKGNKYLCGRCGLDREEEDSRMRELLRDNREKKINI